MNTTIWTMYAAFVVVLLALACPIGLWLARLADNGRELPGYLAGIERATLRLVGTTRDDEMSWTRYALGVLVFNALGVLAVYALQRLQTTLPLNPAGMGVIAADSAFNTAISFVSNTNWQGYGGESTMSYLTQMLALGVQNFLSAATGIAVVLAFIRGFVRRSSATLGNFWCDVSRVTIYLLLPLSLLFAVFLVSQGVVQSFAAYPQVQLVDPITYEQPKLDTNAQPIKDAQGNAVTEKVTATTQTLPLGPAASQIAIKMLGTNGGGFFNANAAHPFENPTPLSNFLQMVGIILISVALCFTFGRMVGDMRQGWVVFAAMSAIFVVFVIAATWAELTGNPVLTHAGLDQVPSALQAGGNMEGKETRFGIAASALFATLTTAASCGAVNAMHDSFTALGGLVPMVLMQLGEVIYGGVGSGLYGMLIYAILAVFIAGLMIGRTPEYLGKKIESYEMKMVAVAILVPSAFVLCGAAIAVTAEAGRAGISNPGAHGFSQILYAFSSASNNNGSAFAGLSANTPFYNLALAVAMWFGRFAVIVPVLAIAGSLAGKKRLAVTAGTLPTHTPLFVVLLIGTVLLVGALTFIPALALGPVAEHLQTYGTH